MEILIDDTKVQYSRVNNVAGPLHVVEKRCSWAHMPLRVVFWRVNLGRAAWWLGWRTSRWDAEERANTGSR